MRPSANQRKHSAGGAAVVLLWVGICASLKIALANSVLGLALMAWVVRLLRGEERWIASPIYLPLLAYLLSSLASVACSVRPRFSLGETGDLLTLALVPMLVSLLDRQRWQWLLQGLAAVAVSSSLVGLWQYAVSPTQRLRGLANHYMTFSGWTLIVVLLLVGWIAFSQDRRHLWWSLPAFTVCTASLLLCLTRNAWVGLAAGLMLVAVIGRPTRPLLLCLGVTAALTLAMPPVVLERVASITDRHQPANYDRLCMMRSGIDMVRERPVFGVGLGLVEKLYPQYREEDAPRQRIPHLHSNPLQIAAERGLVGLLAYLSVLVVFALQAWSVLRQRDHPDLAAVAGCLLAVAGVTIAGLFEYNWGDAEVWILTLTVLSVPFALDDPDRRRDAVHLRLRAGPPGATERPRRCSP